MLIEQDFIDAAKQLNVNPAVVKAVTEVESSGSGFDQLGRLKILFERHHFHRLTKGRFSKSHPDISNPARGGYTEDQHRRLQRACQLDENAALQSASYGLFQIMGFNYRTCGFDSVQAYVEFLKQDERNHLIAFVNFVQNSDLDTPLRQLDWQRFARLYNGPSYKKHAYDIKLRDAYLKHLKRQPTLSLKQIQHALHKLNFYQGKIDGLYGPKTKQAILDYEKQHDLPTNGSVTLQLVNHLLQR